MTVVFYVDNHSSGSLQELFWATVRTSVMVRIVAQAMVAQANLLAYL
jgi:hypothetical protein